MKKWHFYLLSFTWGLPLTLIGCFVALVLVIAGYKPKRFGWCWYFEIGQYWGGLELGVFFLKCKYCTTTLMYHEHGHAFQNTLFGVFMPFVVCIPSAVWYWYREYLHRVRGVDYGDMPDYESVWFEGQATRWGKRLWNGINNGRMEAWKT
ncbi:MAG: hypothetical protein IJO75_01290 [Clostridia bacterium]|nr:hypothetical protein [Clostridia bacterium]